MAPIKTIAAALAVAAAVFGLWWFTSMGSRQVMAIDAPLPGFALEAIEGVEGSGFDQSVLKGRVTLLNAFASWCIPCRAEHPLLVEIAGRGDVTVLGMNVADLPESAVAFLEELGNPYLRVGADPNKTVANRLGLVGLPHTFIVDPEGHLLMSRPGPIDRKFLEVDLPRILAGTAHR